MSDREMLTNFNIPLLMAAFPKALRNEAEKAAHIVLAQLHERQWTDRFEVLVDAERVQLPSRLRFASQDLSDEPPGTISLMVQSLRTRSNDGFQRQRAVQRLLADIRPWSAPFVVALIGEYIVEILHDIYAAISPSVSDTLAAFISANPIYWDCTRQRVGSYWDVYYRADFRRSDYVGFKLIDELETVVRARSVRAS
jgi:hypothetical protein